MKNEIQLNIEEIILSDTLSRRAITPLFIASSSCLRFLA